MLGQARVARHGDLQHPLSLTGDELLILKIYGAII
jgi:hypothetical protein